MFKYIIQSLVVFLLLQGCCSAKSIDNNDELTNPARISDTVSAALDKLKQLANELMQNAYAKMSELFQILTSLAEKIMADTIKKVWDVVPGSIHTINEISKKAVELGVDVACCIDDSEAQIRNIAKTLTNEFKTAVANAVEKGRMMVNETITTITTTMDHIKKIEEQYNKCKGGINIVCYLALMKDIGLQSAAIPFRIGFLMKKLTKYMISAQAEITMLSVQAITKATLQTADIVADVTKCAAKKFENKQKSLLLE